MDFQLNDEDLMIKKMTREFAVKEIQPIAKQLNEEEIVFPNELFQAMGQLGLIGVPYPEEYGGGGGSWLSFVVVHEELSRIDPSVANTVMGNSSVCSLLNEFGTEQQKREWLSPILKGERIGAIAITEPNAGSDARNLKTTAWLDEDTWIINGNKTFISNSGYDFTGPIIVAAVTGQNDDGKKEIGTFIVPNRTNGLLISPPLNKIGFRGNDTRELTFEDCRIPKENLLGNVTKGYKAILGTISAGRILIAAMAVGLAQACLELTLQYVHEREAFGSYLKEFQDVQFKLAEMATKVELSRLITYKAAILKDQNKPFAQEASMAKYFATKSAMEVAHQAVQLHGGYGVMREYDVSRFYGDAKVLEIVEGTNEIQKMLIARMLYKSMEK